MNTAEKDLAQIKALMERSTRFISLSGLSGVFAGLYALIGASLAYYWVYYPNSPFGYRQVYINNTVVLQKLLITAAVIFILSIATGLYFTWRKNRRTRGKLWNYASKRFLAGLALPLATGGVFIFALVLRDNLLMVASTSLIFYGLALVNAAQYTLGDIKYLGICEIVLGLVSAFIPGYGLIFWALGFGVLHIVYGVVMYLKYDG
ncbi:MAG: hypothetical protein JJU02_06760 [Cryomorphaceae bacterium]|nr:hypothetical protein [Cryomorphaceae bacterium]